MKRSFLERAFGRLVRLLPRTFVAEYGPDMAATFGRRIVAARARGRARLALFLAREVGGLVRVAVVEYAAALKTVIFRAFERPTDRATEPTLRRRELMRNVGQDLKHGWRGLGRNPGFTAAVVTVLALGIGATTAMFTMLNAVLLRPLPLPDADRLVGFGNPTLVRQVSSGPSPRTDLFSYELYTELRNGSSLVPALIASGPTTLLDVVVADATPDDEPEHPRARLVSGNYFDVLGVRALAGRTFTPEEDRGPGTGPVTVISHEYWKRRFDLDPSAIGRTILVNGTALTIVGVTPEGFFGEIMDSHMDLWIPLTMQPLVLPGQTWLADRGTSWLLLMGRLRDDATVEQAEAEFTGLARQALFRGDQALDPSEIRDISVDAYAARRGFSSMRGPLRVPLAILMTLSGVVLLIASANVANLMLARTAGRRTEVSVRLALGAGRLRVMRHLLAESVLLGGAAGALAVLVVQLGSAYLLRKARAGGAINLDLSLDLRVLAFAAGLSFLTAIVLGLWPAARATRVAIASALRSQGRGLRGDPLGGAGRRLGLGKWLVIGQVALSLVLLASAGLLFRSLANLQTADLGMARDELLIVRIDAHTAGYPSDRLHNLYAELTERIRQLPGVHAAAYSQNGLFSGSETTVTIQVPGFVAQADSDTAVSIDWVGPGYFETIGARLIRGRSIETRDAAGPPVAVINESMARFYFGDRDPLGEYVQIDSDAYAIIGVVADIESQSLRASPARSLYTPYRQANAGGRIVLEVRTTADPAHLVDHVRRAILAADPALRVARIEPLTALMKQSIEGELLVANVAVGGGGLALALAVLGLYGVMTYTIVRRTSEFGLRLALGANPSQISGMVLRETMLLVGIGALIGIPVAVAAAGYLRSQLVGVGILDLPTLGVSLACLAASAALAGYRPARRAGRVPPHVALNQD